MCTTVEVLLKLVYKYDSLVVYSITRTADLLIPDVNQDPPPPYMSNIM